MGIGKPKSESHAGGPRAASDRLYVSVEGQGLTGDDSGAVFTDREAGGGDLRNAGQDGHQLPLREWMLGV